MTCLNNEGAPAFQFSQLADQQRGRAPSDILFRQRSLLSNVKMQRGHKVGVQIVHRLSSDRSPSTGLASRTSWLLSHLKWASQFVRAWATSFGRPNCKVKGGPFAD